MMGIRRSFLLDEGDFNLKNGDPYVFGTWSKHNWLVFNPQIKLLICSSFPINQIISMGIFQLVGVSQASLREF